MLLKVSIISPTVYFSSNFFSRYLYIVRAKKQIKKWAFIASDNLHEKFGFRTDFEIISEKNLKNICKQTKKWNHRLAKALEVIPSKVHPNDVVLLSTASASQDQYLPDEQIPNDVLLHQSFSKNHV